MKVVVIAFLTFVIATFFSCNPQRLAGTKNEDKLNGLHKYNYPTGELYIEANYKDSLADGTSKIYYKNGKVFEQSEYRLGIKHGLSVKFHENGMKLSETPYDSGRIHGTQKKYRKDGQLSFEAPYWYDKPCVGLKEFYLSGKPVDFPTIIIKPVNNLMTDDSYTLELRLSNGSTNVEFYRGYLTGEKYIGRNVELLHTKNGVGKVFYFVYERGFVMENINIIAKVKTDLNNYYITQRPYNVSIEHY